MGCKRTSKFKSGTKLQIRNLINSIDASNDEERGKMITYLKKNMDNFQDWYCGIHGFRGKNDLEYEYQILTKYNEVLVLDK